jgi:hypothetical protein
MEKKQDGEEEVYIPALPEGADTLTSDMAKLHKGSRGCMVKLPEGFMGSVVIPEGVRRIESSCFLGKLITAVSFPRSLRQIGKRAFKDCLLKELRVEGDGGKIRIEPGAFWFNTELAAITLGNCRLSDDIFRGCPVSRITLTGECVTPERDDTLGFGCWHYTYSDNFFGTVSRVYGSALGTYSMKGKLVRTNYNICVKCDSERCCTLEGFEDDRHKRPDFEWEKEL